ncbi:MAG: GxxExxY protein, partial [Verrucomicrobiota bacterium]
VRLGRFKRSRLGMIFNHGPAVRDPGRVKGLKLFSAGMDKGSHGLKFKSETSRIIGCSMEVLNSLGHGFHEKPYENALVIEFGLKEIFFEQQRRFPIIYKGEKIGEYVPDLIVFGRVIVDTKVIEKVTDRENGQVLNYLKISGLEVGLIINFKNPRLEWKRVAL